MLLKSYYLYDSIYIIFVCCVQPGLSEDELGGPEEVHQRSDQQSQRVEHRPHHPGAAAGEHRQGKVNNNNI